MKNLKLSILLDLVDKYTVPAKKVGSATVVMQGHLKETVDQLKTLSVTD